MHGAVRALARGETVVRPHGDSRAALPRAPAGRAGADLCDSGADSLSVDAVVPVRVIAH